MRKWPWMVVVLALISSAGAQVSSPSTVQEEKSSYGTWKAADPNERMFFPRDMFWGWAQFDLAPPHNEIDPNLCGGNAGQYGGVNAPCSMFARYMLSGILEVRPFGKGPLRRFMVYGAPTFLFGKTVPKTLYTWSFDSDRYRALLGSGDLSQQGIRVSGDPAFPI